MKAKKTCWLTYIHGGLRLTWAIFSFEERAMEQKYKKHPPSNIYEHTKILTIRSQSAHSSVNNWSEKHPECPAEKIFFSQWDHSRQTLVLVEPLFPVALLSRV